MVGNRIEIKITKKMSKELLIYDPELDQITSPDDRYYAETIGEVTTYYPSFTYILGVAWAKDKYFEEWLKEQGVNADTVRDKAAEEGSLVHGLTEAIDAGVQINWQDEAGNFKYPTHIWDMACKYKNFKNRFKYQVIANEHQIVDRELFYAGTVDRVMMLNDEIILVDVKTSNYLSEQYWIQTAAYAMAWNKLNPKFPISRTAIMHLKAQTRSLGNEKKGDIQGYGWKLYFEPEPYQNRLQTIKAIKHIFDTKIPKEKQIPSIKKYPATL